MPNTRHPTGFSPNLGTNHESLTPSSRHRCVTTGHAPTPEEAFIAILALLACQVNTSSATRGLYWAYYPNVPPFQVVTWTNSPIRICTIHPIFRTNRTLHICMIIILSTSFTLSGDSLMVSLYVLISHIIEV